MKVEESNKKATCRDMLLEVESALSFGFPASVGRIFPDNCTA